MGSDEIPGETTAVILARMEVKLDQALIGHADHEARIRQLERKVWAASGVAAFFAAGGAAAVTKLLGG